jgi:hypothetical protein
MLPPLTSVGGSNHRTYQGEPEHGEDRIDTQLCVPQIVMKLSQGKQAALECIGNSLAATPIITQMFVYSHSPPRTSEGVDREGLTCSTFSPLAPSPSRCSPLPTEYLQLSPLPSSPSSPFFGRVCFHLLGQALARLVVEVDLSKRRVL